MSKARRRGRQRASSQMRLPVDLSCSFTVHLLILLGEESFGSRRDRDRERHILCDRRFKETRICRYRFRMREPYSIIFLFNSWFNIFWRRNRKGVNSSDETNCDGISSTEDVELRTDKNAVELIEDSERCPAVHEGLDFLIFISCSKSSWD